MQTMSQKPELKYNINRLLSKMDGKYSDNTLKMCIHVGISPPTAERWKRLSKENNFSIPVEQFYKLADFFNCNPKDLLNNG